MKPTVGPNPSGMVVTDFDGTIFSHGGSFHPEDLESLRRLGEAGYVRVIATGRSLESLYRAIDRSFPVDYIVFSSGAGVYHLKGQELLRRTIFTSRETMRICRQLIEMKVDFMVHHPIPDNHYFHYYSHGGRNPDFIHRIELYREYAAEFDWTEVEQLEATQFVVVMPPGRGVYKRMEDEFADISIIWSTSPLDHRSRWIELFPEGAHKGTGVAWLAEELDIPAARVMVVGNDFNDLHMLEWAEHPFVVANAPEELRERFETVEGCNEGGFTMAVKRWLARAEGDAGPATDGGSPEGDTR